MVTYISSLKLYLLVILYFNFIHHKQHISVVLNINNFV